MYYKRYETPQKVNLEYTNQFTDPPLWVIQKAKKKFHEIKSQSELQEMLVSVALTPDGVNSNDNNDHSKSQWSPTYVAEEVLDEIIREERFEEDQLIALKVGYRRFFDSIGKLIT